MDLRPKCEGWNYKASRRKHKEEGKISKNPKGNKQNQSMNSISNFKTSAPKRHCYKNAKTCLREKIFAT